MAASQGVLNGERAAGVHGTRVRTNEGLPRPHPAAALRPRKGAPDPLLHQHDRDHLRDERHHVGERRGGIVFVLFFFSTVVSFSCFVRSRLLTSVRLVQTSTKKRIFCHLRD